MENPRISKHNSLVEHAVRAFLAILVGLVSSLLILLFKQSIKWLSSGLHHAGQNWLSVYVSWWPVFLPVAGGLAVGLMHQFVLRKERHHGVAGIMEAVASYGGRLPYLQAPAKVLASVFSLGSGASVGPEDPSVQIGANLGSMFGQLCRLPKRHVRLLVATGAASGIATAFNAPMAGVFFAIELIIDEFRARDMGILLLGSVTAVVVTRYMAGPAPAFPVPAYYWGGPRELPFYLGLGMLSAPVALVYIRVLYLAQDWFHHDIIPLWIRPVLIGVLLGVVGLWYPQVLGDGYATVREILWGHTLDIRLLITLIALKLLLTDVSIASGFIGGVFAPSIFLGAALGEAYGLGLTHFFPEMSIQPTDFALTGIAGVLAGAVRAPGTALILLFEMTDDYHIFLPLMFVVAVSMGISAILEQDSIYTLSLRRAGVSLHAANRELFRDIRVKDVMISPPDSVSIETPLREAAALLGQSHVNALPVVDENGRLAGMMSLGDVENAIERSPDNLNRPVQYFCSHSLTVTYPDEPLDDAMALMARDEIGQLPVLVRNDDRSMTGWLDRAAIIHSYKLANRL